MKKFLLTLCISAACTIGANAQRPEGGGGRGQMAEQMKAKLKTELKIEDAKLDSVMAIQRNFGSQIREVRMNSSLTEEQKLERTKKLTEERTASLKKVLTDAQVEQMEAMMQAWRKDARERRESGAPTPQ